MGAADFFVEIFEVGFFLALIGGTAAGVVWLIRLVLRGKILVWLYLLPVILVIFFGFKHIEMSSQLGDLKKEFVRVASGDYSLQPTGEYTDGDEYVTADYGGKLDAIIIKRDKMLNACGFMQVGKWWVTDGEPTVCSFYLYVWVTM